MQQYNQVADSMGLNKNIKKILGITNNEIIVNFPVRMDNDEVKIFTGYRVQHNNALGRLTKEVYVTTQPLMWTTLEL